MYKCTECGTEYKIKPDYCDCGNDEFVITVEESADKETPVEKPAEPKIEQVSTASNIEQENVSVESSVREIRPSVDPISLVVFVVCLILSAIILFVWNPKSEQKTVVQKNDTVVNEIPSINKLWKDSVPIVKEQTTPAAQTPVQTVKQVVKQIQQPVKTTVQKNNKTTQAQKTSQNKTNTVKKQTAATVQQPKQTKSTAAVQQKPAQTQTTQQSQPVTNKPVTQQPVQKQEPSKTQVQTQPQAQTTSKPVVNTAKEKQEFENYKINLRNTIGRKIDFTRVIGDGDCVISFKIDSAGKLISRNFDKQSDNMTLNDAVYKAVMATPSYNPPPSFYKSETLRLYISFNNGNFSISLK